jgi:hypothetical protein
MNTLWICTYTLDSIMLLLLSGELQIIMFQASIILLLYYVLNLVMIIKFFVNCSIKKVIICSIFLPSILICFSFLTSTLFFFRLCFLSSSITCMNIYWWLWFLSSSMTSIKYYWTPIPWTFLWFLWCDPVDIILPSRWSVWLLAHVPFHAWANHFSNIAQNLCDQHRGLVLSTISRCQLSVYHSLIYYFMMLDYLDHVNLANPPTKHQCFAW